MSHVFEHYKIFCVLKECPHKLFSQFKKFLAFKYSKSTILVLTILIVIFAACVTQGTCLHCKYAELNNKTGTEATMFEKSEQHIPS